MKSSVDWRTAPLSRLVAHLTVDHTELRYDVIGGVARSFTTIEGRAIFTALVELLRRHLTREDHVVFPLIEAMERMGLPPHLEGGLTPVVARLSAEHDLIQKTIRELRSICGDRIAPLEAAILGCMELENTILFPRALALEKTLRLTQPVAGR
ncbi:MAG TPA: hemerythrin domain-containing protein [Thermoanaerobaculia bacterium]|nr:hemerythrin domain-containing protein [Thermoanaerobaculia bacterium]